MNKEDSMQMSITELIVDEMFAQIEKHEEFDKETIQELRGLALRGQLKTASQVIEAIKTGSR